MRCLFTVHAGEYLVGSEIEKRIRQVDVWLPSKDRGIDLLVTGRANNGGSEGIVSIQVKFSKDFAITDDADLQKYGLEASSWYSLIRDKIITSPADIWIFVILPFKRVDINYVIIPKDELNNRLNQYKKSGKRLDIYFRVIATSNNSNECWDTRGLSRQEQIALCRGENHDKEEIQKRCFTQYINAWRIVEEKLK
jgi:hypothetical protein